MDPLVGLSPEAPRRFGPPPPRLHAVPPPGERPQEREPPPAPRVVAKAETCKVVLWHSHLKHQLYVASLAKDADWRPLAVSPFFRLEDEDVPTEQAETALRMLIEQLEREGWAVVSGGKRWHDVKLARSRNGVRAERPA